MSESPPRREQIEGQSGATADGPLVVTGFRLAFLILLAFALLGGLLVWVGARSERRRHGETAGESPANQQEPPPSDPAAA